MHLPLSLFLRIRKKVYNAIMQRFCRQKRQEKKAKANDKHAKGDKVEIEMSSRTVRHTNPLVYNRSLSRKQEIDNPYHGSSMTTNPISTVAVRSARQSAMKKMTSLRLSRLRILRESQRERANDQRAPFRHQRHGWSF